MKKILLSSALGIAVLGFAFGSSAQAAGIGLEEVLDFSRHKDVRVLMIYRDRDRNVQGRLANLVAETAV